MASASAPRFLSPRAASTHPQRLPFPSLDYISMNASYSYAAMEVDEAPGADVAESRSAVRSCTTCSKAKAKCVKRPDQQICERYFDHVDLALTLV